MSPQKTKVIAGGNSLVVVLTSELGRGATGIVHGGTMSLPGAEGFVDVTVAVKLAEYEEHHEYLKNEHSIYRQLTSRGVKGLPVVLGYFLDENEDVSILVMTYSGRSLYHKQEAINSTQQ